MGEQSRWAKRRMKCPEGMGESDLLLEWCGESGEEVLNSISCDNLQLKDLSGRDCQWSCWEGISIRELP